MRQGCEREAGKQKHNHAERRVWIFDRHTCFLVRFGASVEPKGLSSFSSCISASSLDRVVHLPVPSENVSWRGKRIVETLKWYALSNLFSYAFAWLANSKR